MTNYRYIYQQIQIITQKLILVGLSSQQNEPTLRGKSEITYAGMKNISIALKDVEYIEIYKELDKNRNYNIKMIDGAWDNLKTVEFLSVLQLLRILLCLLFCEAFIILH